MKANASLCPLLSKWKLFTPYFNLYLWLTLSYLAIQFLSIFVVVLFLIGDIWNIVKHIGVLP